MAPTDGWVPLLHTVMFKQRLLQYHICLASMALADGWAPLLRRVMFKQICLVEYGPSRRVGSAADSTEVFWDAMMEAQRVDGVADHPREWCCYESSLVQQRVRCFSVGLCWLESQGELPSTPVFVRQRGLQTKVPRVPTRATQMRDEDVHASSIGLP